MSESHNRDLINKAAGAIDDAHQAIYKNTNTLDSDVGQLMSYWKGDAAKAYFQAYTKVDEKIEKVGRDLEWIHGQMVDTGTKYTMQEAEAVEDANPILSMLESGN